MNNADKSKQLDKIEKDLKVARGRMVFAKNSNKKDYYRRVKNRLVAEKMKLGK